MSKDPTMPTDGAAGILVIRHIGEVFTDGWLLMVAFGIAHGTDHAIPAFGYWQSLFFAWVLGGIAATAQASTHARIKKLGELVTKPPDRFTDLFKDISRIKP